MIKRKPTQTSEVSETVKEIITTNETLNTETSETEAKPKPTRRRTPKVVQPVVDVNDSVEEIQQIVEKNDTEIISQSDILEAAAAIAEKKKLKKVKMKDKEKEKAKKKKAREKEKEKQKKKAKKAKEKKKKKEKIKKAKQKAKEKKKTKSKKKKK